jgi:hypothetical protein
MSEALIRQLYPAVLIATRVGMSLRARSGAGMGPESMGRAVVLLHLCLNRDPRVEGLAATE